LLHLLQDSAIGTPDLRNRHRAPDSRNSASKFTQARNLASNSRGGLPRSITQKKSAKNKIKINPSDEAPRRTGPISLQAKDI
jgi:hypothetical protein